MPNVDNDLRNAVLDRFVHGRVPEDLKETVQQSSQDGDSLAEKDESKPRLKPPSDLGDALTQVLEKKIEQGSRSKSGKSANVDAVRSFVNKSADTTLLKEMMGHLRR